MKRDRHVTATELAECCVCEQRVVFDHLRGRRRTAACRRHMRAGSAAHEELHREALGELGATGGDARCFVATALWGAADPRTQALREWRDRWLLERRWGRGASCLYYRLSPLLVAVIRRVPVLRVLADVVLSAVVRQLTLRQE